LFWKGFDQRLVVDKFVILAPNTPRTLGDTFAPPRK
jgi:hypothetical protein